MCVSRFGFRIVLEVNSPVAPVAGEDGANKRDDNHTFGDPASDRFGRASHLALQPELGLLSKRWSWSGGGHPAGVAAIRADLTATQHSENSCEKEKEAGRFSALLCLYSPDERDCVRRSTA